MILDAAIFNPSINIILTYKIPHTLDFEVEIHPQACIEKKYKLYFDHINFTNGLKIQSEIFSMYSI